MTTVVTDGVRDAREALAYGVPPEALLELTCFRCGRPLPMTLDRFAAYMEGVTDPATLLVCGGCGGA